MLQICKCSIHFSIPFMKIVCNFILILNKKIQLWPFNAFFQFHDKPDLIVLNHSVPWQWMSGVSSFMLLIDCIIQIKNSFLFRSFKDMLFECLQRYIGFMDLQISTGTQTSSNKNFITNHCFIYKSDVVVMSNEHYHSLPSNKILYTTGHIFKYVSPLLKMSHITKLYLPNHLIFNSRKFVYLFIYIKYPSFWVIIIACH